MENKPFECFKRNRTIPIKVKLQAIELLKNSTIKRQQINMVFPLYLLDDGN